MRTVSGSDVVYSTDDSVAGAGQRTDYLQSSSMTVLLARFQALTAELDAQPGTDWTLIFANLAGGGNGAEFVLELRWADELADGVTAEGIDTVVLQSFGAMAAQSAANKANFDAALAAYQVQSEAAGSEEVEMNQTLLAGASQGARVADLMITASD